MDNFKLSHKLNLYPYIFYRAMFCNDLREKHEENVNIKGIDADTMGILLEYTYTSKVIITKDNVQRMLEAASLFQVCTINFISNVSFMDNIFTCSTSNMIEKPTCKRSRLSMTVYCSAVCFCWVHICTSPVS